MSDRANHVEGMLLDFDGWLGQQDDETKAGIGQYLGVVPAEQRDAAKATLASQFATSEATGIPLADVSSRWDLVRGGYAAQQGGEWAQSGADDNAFNTQWKKQATKIRDTRLLGDDLAEAATRAELIRDAALTPDMVTANASDIPSWEKWSFTAPGKPGFDQAQSGQYFQQWAATQDRTRKLVEPLRPQINDAWNLLSGEPNAGEVLGLADVLSQMPTKDRKTVLWAIQQRAESMPEEKKKAFWERSGRAFMSSLDQMLTAMATGPERIGDMVFGDFGASPEDRSQLRKRQDTLEELRNLQTQKIQPFEDANDGWAAKVGLGVAQSAPALIGAFAGPVGWYGIGAQMTDEARGTVRPALEKALRAQGLTEDQAEERSGVIAEPLAIAAGAINTAVEKLTFGMAMGVPGIRGLQAKLITTASESLAKRIALRGGAFALEAGEQQLQEAVQDAMPFALADAAQAVGIPLPEVDGGAKQFLSTILDPTTLGVSLLFAAGGFGHVDGVTLAEGLRREGVNSEKIQEIIATPDNEKVAAVVDAIKSVDPAERTAAQASAARQDAAAKAAGAIGAMPTFRVNPDGIGVFLNGQHIGNAPTTQAAMELGAAASEHFADMDADQTALLASMLETADTFATQQDGGVVSYTEVSPNRRTVAQQLAESAAQGDTQTEARLREEIRLMAEAEGVDPATLSLIAGDNVTTFQNGVAYSVSRVFEGASPLTVVHENAHGSFKAGLRNGVFTRAGTIAVVRGVEQATGQKFFQSTDDGAIGEAELEETVMQLAEAEVLGRRKRGDALAPGAITKGIAAYIRQEARSGAAALKEALSFKHFMSAVRRTMKAVFSRALALRKAQAEGKLDGDYRQFIDKLLGVDTQISHEEAVSQAALDYVPPTAEQEAAGMAFSLLPDSVMAPRIAAATAVYDQLESDLQDDEQLNNGQNRKTLLRDANREAVAELLRELPLPDGWEYVSDWTGSGGAAKNSTTSSWYAEVQAVGNDALESPEDPIKLTIRDHEQFSRQHNSPDLWAMVPANRAVWAVADVVKAAREITEKLAQKSQSTSAGAESSMQGSGSAKTGDGTSPQPSDSVNPKGGMAFSLAPAAAQRDAEYLKAVEAGDMETAQRMVDEAAKAAGYDRMLFHQTHKDNVPKIYESGFRLDIPGARASDNEMPDGIFLKPDESNIKVGAANAEDIRQMRLFVRLKNPLIFNNRKELVQFVSSKNPAFSSTQAEFTKTDRAIVSEVDKLEEAALSKPPGKEQDDAWNRYFDESDVIFEKGRRSLNEIAARARAISTAAVRSGADGIIVYNDAGSFGRATTTAVALDPNQIKSADPVTRDESGNVIPLSQRFDSSKDSISFALAPAGRLATVESRVQQALDKDPELKRRVFADIRSKLARLANDWSSVRWTAKGDKIAPIVEKRSAKSLAKEQAFREATRRDELTSLYAGPIEHQFAGIIHQPELAKLGEHPLFQMLRSNLGGGLFKSRIMSPTQSAIRDLNAGRMDQHGDYDGADGIPRMMFGGTEAPDTLAQEAFEAGLIKDATPDALWDGIRAGLRDVAQARDDLKYALDALKDAQRRARDEAKAEAAQWRREADAAQKRDHSPKAAMLRDLVTLDAMLTTLPPEVRAKVGGYVSIARLGTDASRLAELQKRADMIGREMEAFLRKFYAEEIQALFDRAKPTKGGPGEKPIGKVGADVYKLVQAAAGAMELTPDETDARLAEIDTLLAAVGLTPEDEAMLDRERGLVELFGAWHPKSIASQRLDKNGNPIYVRAYDGADAARRAAAFDSLKTLIDEGMADWKQELTRRKERRDAMRAALKASTGKSGARSERVSKDKEAKTLFGKGLNFLLSISSFDEVARYAFGDGSSEARAMVDQERAASNAYEDEMQDVTDSVQALFEDMAGSPLEAEKLRFQLSQRTKDGGVAGEMSELEIIQAVLMWRQEDGRRHMTGPLDEDGKPAGPWHFDQAWVDSVTAQLSPEGRRVLDHIAQEYAAEYATLNPLYEQRHGISLPANTNYAPITVAPQQASAGQMVDPVSGAAVTGSILTPGSLRTRSRSAVAEPDFKDGLQVFLAHKRQMAHWKAYYDFAVEAQQVLGNREVGNAVSAAAGEQAKVVLRKWVDAFAQGGSRDAAAGLAATDTLQRMTGRAAAAALVGRVSVLMIQSTQLAAASVEMPDGGYIKRLGKLLSGNLGWGDAIRSDYIQRRLSQQPPIIRQAMEALANQTEPNRLKHEVARLGRLINGADGLFTAGTYAMLLDYHRQNAAKLGLTGAEAEKFAHENAARSTDRVAQPTRMGARSIWEVTSTNPLARLSWAFASEARQKIALVGWSGVNIRSNPKRFAKTFFLAWVVGGVAAEVIRSAYRDLKDDDDEEVFDARNWSPTRLVMSALAGPLKGVPGLSAIFETGGNLFSSGQRGAAAAKSLISGDAFDSDEPVEETLRDVDSILTAMALFNDNAAAIASLAHAGLDGAKLIDSLADDDVEAGLKQLRKEAADRKNAKGEPSDDQAAAAKERKRARIKAAADRAKKD